MAQKECYSQGMMGCDNPANKIPGVSPQVSLPQELYGHDSLGTQHSINGMHHQQAYYSGNKSPLAAVPEKKSLSSSLRV